MQKSVILGISLIIIAVFGGLFFDDITHGFEGITGWSLTNTTSLSISISSTPPVIYYFGAISQQTITESSSITVPFVVSVYDIDGIKTIANSSSMNASAALSGEVTRTNLSCVRMHNINTTAANYSCTLTMWYFDGAGDWTVNVSVFDTSNAIADTKNTTFTLASTPAMIMAPLSLTWSSIAMTSVNQSATNNPIILNNTGNKPITAGNVKVEAIDLQGGTTATEYLRAANFRVGPTTSVALAECGATAMVNETATAIDTATLAKGNNTAGYGNSTLYFCLANVTGGITPQTYSTAVSGKWTISIA
jgi:hypothetical protein